MSWTTQYRSRIATADQAVANLVGSERVYLSGNAATPRGLVEALARRAVATEEGPFHLSHVLLMGDNPTPAGARHRPWFVGPADRHAVGSGEADYAPCHLSEIPRLIAECSPPLDVAMLSVAPPDNHGFLSLGTEVMASLAAAEHARRVIVQVNPQMPRVLGNAFLHVSEVDAIVEMEASLPELTPQPPTDVQQAIARHIVPLIPEGATLQLGIGGIPDAVIGLLSGRDDLGVHSEMISDGVMRAVASGTVTGRHKTLHRRKVITTFVLGSRALYDWVHENAALEAHPCDYTNDLLVASQNDHLVAINSAISIDLSGQVNSDSIGSRIYSGVGGQLDFLRAAARSRGGVPIIALPSTAKRGTQSRIVPTLAQGAGVVTTRADVHWVVTEFGAVNLYGRSLRTRAQLLISVAHPDFRDTLRAQLAEQLDWARSRQ